MTGATVAIEAQGLRKRFGAVSAVDGVDLEVAPGDLTVLLGPSGCGKSTLLRLIAGFERPDDGSIRLFDEVVAAPGGGVMVSPEDRGVGIVFQQLALFPHLDVAANIAYGLRRAGRAERKARVEELLELIDLYSAARRFPISSQAGKPSGWRWPEPWRPPPRSCCSTSPSRASTPRCGLPCEPRSGRS